MLTKNSIPICDLMIYLFICHASLNISAYYLLTSTFKNKSLQRTYTLLIQYLHIEPILSCNSSSSSQKYLSPADWCCRIHRLHLCRGVRPHSTTTTTTTECPENYIKPSDGELLELWGIWSTRSLSLLLGPFSVVVVAHDNPIYGSNWTVWHLNSVQTNGWCLIELSVVHSKTGNHLTVCKQMSKVE